MSFCSLPFPTACLLLLQMELAEQSCMEHADLIRKQMLKSGGLRPRLPPALPAGGRQGQLHQQPTCLQWRPSSMSCRASSSSNSSSNAAAAAMSAVQWARLPRPRSRRCHRSSSNAPPQTRSRSSGSRMPLRTREQQQQQEWGAADELRLLLHEKRQQLVP